jgi:hypothetical protein
MPHESRKLFLWTIFPKRKEHPDFMGLWHMATPTNICLGTSTYELNFNFRKIFI